MHQLIAKLQMLPAYNIPARQTLLEIIEKLNQRISTLEDRVERLEGKNTETCECGDKIGHISPCRGADI